MQKTKKKVLFLRERRERFRMRICGEVVRGECPLCGSRNDEKTSSDDRDDQNEKVIAVAESDNPVSGREFGVADSSQRRAELADTT
ncbi:MAG TPA: hypothetical protein VL572_09385 [Pyrinomonadaceae bacterium]|nr:hypothetical protein [Pyrinomonadaceae bacterium]